MAKDTKKQISHDEVQRALKRFQEQGGLITQLPDQVVPPRNRVGGKFAVYESVTESGSSEGARS